MNPSRRDHTDGPANFVAVPRTHRERKEQYIRALEGEISRLRESYSTDISSAHSTIQQHRRMLQELQQQNETLKEILHARGILFEPEFERRRAEYLRQTPRPLPTTTTTNTAAAYSSDHFAASSTGSPSNGFSAANTAILQTPPSTYSTASPEAGVPDRVDSSKYGHFHAGSTDQPPSLLELSSSADPSNGPSPVPLPGIFEDDPQLGIDFILRYVANYSSIKKSEILLSPTI
jgi:hypothetical protein